MNAADRAAIREARSRAAKALATAPGVARDRKSPVVRAAETVRMARGFCQFCAYPVADGGDVCRAHLDLLDVC